MATTARQALRPWPIRRTLLEDQEVELAVLEEGVLIRSAHPRLSLAERLEAYRPMEADATEAMAWGRVGSPNVWT
ncbi:AbrB/MazE/SpoVT family DNA-binding domain-containing protein [Cyanobium sp. NS01]|uniref:AbrB/MazE/SpoVT family DNA-binding domain-containing protein n=1 Tax=Cyanobium sp. NS01 TaxID=261284 RepID=UPI0016443476|nr:AbrB/MazE/SpoVT family DNA-binding domain-containing protein [Cyanobium sp. NS01]